MGLLDLASGNSLWRGYDYFEEKKVQDVRKIEDGCYEGVVSGSGKKLYHVTINLPHPRTSKCNCPHADGKRIICKHMAAMYFTVFPEEAKRFYEEVIAAQEEEEKQQEELENKLITFVSKMKKDELQQALLEMLFDGPEWQYERFMREHWIE